MNYGTRLGVPMLHPAETATDSSINRKCWQLFHVRWHNHSSRHCLFQLLVKVSFTKFRNRNL